MADYSALMKAMKQVAVDAIKASKPVTVCFGKVIGTLPLKIQIDQKITLGAAQLVLTEKVTENIGLQIGDEVVLLRQQGGQKYIVLDRVVKA